MREDFLAVWNSCIHMVQDMSSSSGDLNMLVNSGQTVLRCESNQHDLSMNIYDDRLLQNSVTQKLCGRGNINKITVTAATIFNIS